MQKKIPQRSIDFSKADDMGNETNISIDSGSQNEDQEPEKKITSGGIKVYGSSTKRGINNIHDTSISMRMPLSRGPTQ